MFASQVKETVRIPIKDGDDVDVIIRKLSAVSLEKASKVKTGEQIADAKGFGPDMMRVVLDGAAPTKEVEEAKEKLAAEDPAERRFRKYDRMSVLRAGVESWDAKYPEGHMSAGLPVPVGTGIDDLTEATVDILFRRIIALSVPTEEEESEARGKS